MAGKHERMSQRVTSLSQPQMPLIKKLTASTETPPLKEIEVVGPQFMIMNLAIEIQLKILKNLDYKTLLHISATCKHFRALFLDHDKETYKLALVAYEEESVAWRTSLTGEATYAPCYGCLKTLSRCHFSSYEWHASSTSTGVRAFRRRCATCMFGGQLTGPSRVIADEWGWLFCERCKQLTHLVQFDLCGLWDHTRDGEVWCLQNNPLPPEQSLCRECSPWIGYAEDESSAVRARNRLVLGSESELVFIWRDSRLSETISRTTRSATLKFQPPTTPSI